MNREVGECGEFEADELPGFEQCSLPLPAEDDGALCATLIRKRLQGASSAKPAVLYLHGFVDYFFQTHLADAFEDAGYRFYALDLRRYGRSLRPFNRPNWAQGVEDYFREIDTALSFIERKHTRVEAVVAHSTGALIAAHYFAKAPHQHDVSCLVFNSPFFRFHLGGFNLLKLKTVVHLARWFPKVVLPEKMPSIYGRTLHVSQKGEWSYDLLKKPLEGFPLYSGWFRMIVLAQEELPRLKLEPPLLVLHSDKSKRPRTTLEPDDFLCDTVLNVEDMKNISPHLSPRVTLTSIEGGVHDLILSGELARKETIEKMISFVDEHRKTK